MHAITDPSILEAYLRDASNLPGHAERLYRPSTAEEVAEIVVKGLAEEKFLILPHPEVGDYFLRKATDYDRWLRGMRRLQTQIQGA